MKHAVVVHSVSGLVWGLRGRPATWNYLPVTRLTKQINQTKAYRIHEAVG
jgi:hypothetical protein